MAGKDKDKQNRGWMGLHSKVGAVATCQTMHRLHSQTNENATIVETEKLFMKFARVE